MLIIMNPPFGLKAKICTLIHNSVKEIYNESILVELVPQRQCGRVGYEYVNKATPLIVPFGEVCSDRFCILQYTPYKVNKTVKQFMKMMLKGKKDLYKLWNCIENYNKGKIGPKLVIQCVVSNKYERAKQMKEFLKKYDRNKIFFMSLRQVDNEAAHVTGNDVEVNLYKKDPRDPNYCSSFKFFEFNSPLELNNFTKWWYSKAGMKDSLFNKVINIYAKHGLYIWPISKFLEYFPKVDWTREWTDEEIYKEIGYTK